MSGNLYAEPMQLPESRTPRYEFNMTLSPTDATDGNAFPSPPFTRDSSPSPSISPTPALSACPPLDRSFSATSSASTFSRQSTVSRSSSASTALRKRGYVRPQGATFSASARNRDSVLSLGSIAHLQYYFARTGLLDGKGGQLAKDLKKKPIVADSPLNDVLHTYAGSEFGSNYEESTESPLEYDESTQGWDESIMLPPTVSTYSHRVQYLPPPPDSEMLRNDLIKALNEAGKSLRQVQETMDRLELRKPSNEDLAKEAVEQDYSCAVESSSGWHQIEGMHILDVVTLAIRAAKIYYTTHEHPQRLYNIKSERQIREELLAVLDVLKRMAGRNFLGGLKTEELRVMQGWIKGIESFVVEEQVLEKQETHDRESWNWLEGSWVGREREREWLFMCSFLPDATLPEWTPLDQHTSPFLQSLRTGLTLVTLHNAMLKKSKRQFGEITAFHTDTAKPYRCADNLRYWIKAAEIRWEIKLQVDVSGVIHSSDAAWTGFDFAILEWSKAAREELTKEWREGSIDIAASRRCPSLHLVEGSG